MTPTRLQEIEARWNALPTDIQHQYAPLIADLQVLLTRLKAAEAVCEAAEQKAKEKLTHNGGKFTHVHCGTCRLHHALTTWEAARDG